MAKSSLTFDQGTLLWEGRTLQEVRHDAPGVPWKFDRRVNSCRTDGYWYREVKSCITQAGLDVSDRVRRWQAVAWSKNNVPALREEQVRAVEKFLSKGGQGVVVMPTGTGKTLVAVEIMRRLGVASLIVAPIRDLMYQWHRRIAELLNYDAGVIGDNLFNRKAVSVTTYDSAAIHAGRLGNRFGLIVFDECHHLPGSFYRESSLMSAAPYRLGLTATPQRSDGKHKDLDYLIGETVYELKLREVAGSSLADYRVVRIPVKLSASERERYDKLTQKIRAYVYERRKENTAFVWKQLCNESNSDSKSREILRAFQQKQAIENRAAEKLRVIEDLFQLHFGEPIIVFVGSNAMARQVSIRFLVPCLLSHCGKRERYDVLDGFANGIYPAIVANQILDEGIDLPEAKIAIVVGGSSSTRQAKQRLGRILRRSNFGQAILYEVVLDETNENLRSRARRRSDAFGKRSESGSQ